MRSAKIWKHKTLKNINVGKKGVCLLQMGLLDMETIMLNRINYVNRAAKTNKDIRSKTTWTTHKESQKEVTDKISDDLGMGSEDKEGENT